MTTEDVGQGTVPCPTQASGWFRGSPDDTGKGRDSEYAGPYRVSSTTKVDKVTLVRAKTPKVTFKDGELTVHVNPDDGWSGRVTPEAITNALTSARNAG